MRKIFITALLLSASVLSPIKAFAQQFNQYLFWDEVHPTTRGHELIAQYAASVINAPKTFVPQGEVGLNFAKRQTQLIDARLLALRTTPTTPGDSNRVGAFINGDINFGDRETTSKYPGYDFTTSGVTAGVDYRVADNLAVGLALGYAIMTQI